MNTTADLSILTLIANASLVVKAVLAILIVLSLASWTVIFQKFFVVRRAMRQTDDFESRFGAARNSRNCSTRPTAPATLPAWKSASLPPA